MATWIAVFVGGALGSAARHGVNIVAARIAGTATPWATAMVNMIGSMAIGVLAGAIVASRVPLSRPLQAFLFVGVLGGFTTFSSFMLDSFTLMQMGDTAKAGTNLFGQLAVGLALTYAGYQIGLRLA